MSLFEVRNISFSRGGKQILNNISFKIYEGECLSILGANGAGKTTLIKCILGLVHSQNGEVLLFEKPIKSYGKALWQYIGYVAQAKHNVLNIKVLDMVTLGFNPTINFIPKAQHFKIAKQTLDMLSLTHLTYKHCCELSGGELQMVLFARALVCKPKILILDEPESNLDFANQKIILDTLKYISKQGCAIIFNTHFPSHALYLSHKALLITKQDSMSKQSNALFGQASEILTQEHLSALYNVPLHLIDRKVDNAQETKGYMIYIT